jgi:hypothetical protein
LAPESVGILALKFKTTEILGWVKNLFFYLKNSKGEIFQKVVPRFVVLLKFCRRLFSKKIRNGGSIQDGGFLTLYFQKFGKNQ